MPSFSDASPAPTGNDIALKTLFLTVSNITLTQNLSHIATINFKNVGAPRFVVKEFSLVDVSGDANPITYNDPCVVLTFVSDLINLWQFGARLYETSTDLLVGYATGNIVPPGIILTPKDKMTLRLPALGSGAMVTLAFTAKLKLEVERF